MSDTPTSCPKCGAEKDDLHALAFLCGSEPVRKYFSETCMLREAFNKERETNRGHESKMLTVIDERDKAEESLSQAYFLIMGRAAEWSNLFGHEEALQDIDESQSCFRSQLAASEAKLREMTEIARELDEHSPESVSHQGWCGDYETRDETGCSCGANYSTKKLEEARSRLEKEESTTEPVKRDVYAFINCAPIYIISKNDNDTFFLRDRVQAVRITDELNRLAGGVR